MEKNYQNTYKYINQGGKDVNDINFGFQLKIQQIRKDAIKRGHKVYFLSEEEAYKDLLENKAKADIDYKNVMKILELLPKNICIQNYMDGDAYKIYQNGVYIAINYNSYTFLYPYEED